MVETLRLSAQSTRFLQFLADPRLRPCGVTGIREDEISQAQLSGWRKIGPFGRLGTHQDNSHRVPAQPPAAAPLPRGDKSRLAASGFAVLPFCTLALWSLDGAEV